MKGTEARTNHGTREVGKSLIDEIRQVPDTGILNGAVEIGIGPRRGVAGIDHHAAPEIDPGTRIRAGGLVIGPVIVPGVARIDIDPRSEGAEKILIQGTTVARDATRVPGGDVAPPSRVPPPVAVSSRNR